MSEEQRAARLLEAASERLKDVSDETSAFNILSVLQLERYETRTHSKIIFFLLNSRQNGENRFLRLFLEMLKIPGAFLNEQWKVYREKSFDDGSNRIDFVLESASYRAIVEMKIDAADGDGQLSRYAAFGKRKRKKYGTYYLTLDGHAPQKQCVLDVEPDRLWCVSFEKDILSWLQMCMDTVPEDGWQYSFLKQYLGAVRQITGTGDEEANVRDLIGSSDMARAARIVADNFYEKMDEVTECFFQNLENEIKTRIPVDTYLYTNGLDVLLGSFGKKRTYYMTLGVFFDPWLYVCFGFSKKNEEGGYQFLPLDKAEGLFPRTYPQWMGKLDALADITKQKIHRSKLTKWLYLEDARGAQLNFKDYSAQIRLVDEMEDLCGWITEDLVRHWILPLTRE